MVNGNQQLPDGWVLESLGNVTKINGRDVAIRDLSDKLPVTFVPMAAVDAEKGIIAQPEERPLKEVRKGFTPFSDGDVLLAKITPSMENGKAAIARNLKNGRGFGSTEFHVFRPKEVVTAEWVFHFIRQESFRRDAKANFAGTAGQLRVPAGFLVDYPIPIPPLPEQERIVAKIEELFTQLDAGTSALERVQAGLRRYKASVLKAAVEGRLVPYGHGGAVPVPGELPEGWRLDALENICSIFVDSAHRTPKYGDTGVPAIGPRDVVNGNLKLEKARLVNEEEFKIQTKRHVPSAGDIVYSRELSFGWGAIIPENVQLCLSQGMCLFRTNDEVDNRYLLMAINGPLGRKQAEDVATGSAHPHVNLSDIKAYRIPIPPLEEQRRIVAEVERRLSVAREVESIVEKALARSTRLRQAVLKSAFEGRL